MDALTDKLAAATYRINELEARLRTTQADLRWTEAALARSHFRESGFRALVDQQKQRIAEGAIAEIFDRLFPGEGARDEERGGKR